MPATRIWLKNPLAIFTANGLDARGGLVLQDGVISEVLANVGRQAAVIFDALLPTLRVRWPDMNAEQLKLIETELTRARNLMAGVSLADLKADEPEDDS